MKRVIAGLRGLGCDAFMPDQRDTTEMDPSGQADVPGYEAVRRERGLQRADGSEGGAIAGTYL